MDFWTFITSGLLRNPVCQAGDWGSARPWPRPLLAGRGPDGEDDRTPVETSGKGKCVSPLVAGILSFARVSNANHMAFKVSSGLDTVAKTPRYSVGIKLGYCSFFVIRTTSKPTSKPGAKTRSVPVAADTTPRNAHLNRKKGSR